MSQRPLLLVTNDDGVQAPGLQALAAALAEVGEVHVVAPDREVSACSQSLTLTQPLRVDKVSDRVHAVDGTPADCVNLAVVKLLPRRPDVLFSGINRGANLGDDIFYSGTVGGAREGTFFGIPSVAMSLADRSPRDYSYAAALAARLARLLVEHGLPDRTLLNVNVPQATPRGVMITAQGRREHHGTILEGLDPRQRTYYWIEEGRDRWMRDDLADIHAVRHGYVSVTPLHTDTTHREAVASLRDWGKALGDGAGS